MKLTDEQRAEIERQRRESPGERIVIEETPEQAAEYRRAVAEEEAGRAANIAYCRKLDAAAAEPGFAGDLRRAIKAAKRDPRALADDLNISVELLEDFLAGDATLPSDVVDRVATVLGLKLVVEAKR